MNAVESVAPFRFPPRLFSAFGDLAVNLKWEPMVTKGIWYGAAFGLGLLASGLRAQERPLNVRGTFSTGYYFTSARSETSQSLSFVPFGARFDVTGFYRTPDLLYFSAQPELNVGPQASEAGFQGGNGVAFRATLLRRLIPITFRYANLQVQDVYFGSLSQLSGYSLKNRNKDLGVTMEFKSKKSPGITFDWGRESVSSTSGTQGVSDYLSHGNHTNVDSTWEHWGFQMQGFFHRQEQQSEVLAPTADGGAHLGSLRQTVLHYQGSAQRTLWEDSELYIDGGRQSTSNLLFTLPIDLATHFASANLRLRQRHRWKSSLRAAYSSNLSSQLLEQAAGSLTGATSVLPDGNILTPFSRSISSLNFTGLTSVTMPHGFGLHASVERNSLFSSSLNAPLNADYFTSSGGVTYAKPFHWGNLSGEYARDYGIGSITGQSGTIQGQSYRAAVQKGNSGGLQLDATVHGVEQSVHNVQPLSNKAFSTEGAIGGRLLGSFNVRAGGGWQWSTVVNSANEFRTNGYTARASIEHSRFQVTGNLNNSLSDSLPFYSQILSGLGIDGLLVAPLQKIPSDYRARSLAFHTTPMRKLELSAVWTRSRQHLDGVLSNDFQVLNAYLTYHFRRLQLEAGYIQSNQTFAFYPNTLRKRFYLRIVRSMKLL